MWWFHLFQQNRNKHEPGVGYVPWALLNFGFQTIAIEGKIENSLRKIGNWANKGEE